MESNLTFEVKLSVQILASCYGHGGRVLQGTLDASNTLLAVVGELEIPIRSGGLWVVAGRCASGEGHRETSLFDPQLSAHEIFEIKLSTQRGK